MLSIKNIRKTYKKIYKKRFLDYDIEIGLNYANKLLDSVGMLNKSIKQSLVCDKNGNTIGRELGHAEYYDKKSICDKERYVLRLTKHTNEKDILKVLDHEVMHLLLIKINELEACVKFDIIDTYNEPFF